MLKALFLSSMHMLCILLQGCTDLTEHLRWDGLNCEGRVGALIWLGINQSHTHTHSKCNFVVMNTHTSRSMGALHQHINPLCLFDLLLGIRESLPGGFSTSCAHYSRFFFSLQCGFCPVLNFAFVLVLFTEQLGVKWRVCFLERF